MENKIMFKTIDGREIEGTVLATLNYNNNEFILYTDDNIDNMDLKILAAKIKYEKDNLVIQKIEHNEWQYIEKVIDMLNKVGSDSIVHS